MCYVCRVLCPHKYHTNITITLFWRAPYSIQGPDYNVTQPDTPKRSKGAIGCEGLLDIVAGPLKQYGARLESWYYYCFYLDIYIYVLCDAGFCAKL